MVGDLPEVAEVEPNNEDTKAQQIDLNTTVNGTFAGPQDVDYYVFPATKGQRVVVSCLAASIDSRANPAIEVYDKDDKQLASNNNYRDTDAADRLHRPRRRRLPRPRHPVHAHLPPADRRRPAGRQCRPLLPPQRHHRPVDRLRLPLRHRAGQDGRRHGLRPQPARRQARPVGRRR